MIEVTVKVEGCCDHHHPKLRIVPRLGPFREQSSPVTKAPRHQRHPFHAKRYKIMVFEMTVTQQVDVTISVQDSRGNPAKLDGVPVWATDNSDVAELTPSVDGLTCTIKAVGMVGVANVQVTGDADLGAGSEPIIGTLEASCTPGKATVIQLNPGTPTEQP